MVLPELFQSQFCCRVLSRKTVEPIFDYVPLLEVECTNAETKFGETFDMSNDMSSNAVGFFLIFTGCISGLIYIMKYNSQLSCACSW